MSMYTIIMLVALGAMFFFSMRKQKKAQEDRKNELNNMRVGSEIVTIGGLHGVLADLDKEAGTFDLDAEGVILTFDLSAVRTVKSPKVNQVEPTTETSDESPKEVVVDEVKSED